MEKAKDRYHNRGKEVAAIYYFGNKRGGGGGGGGGGGMQENARNKYRNFPEEE